MANPLNIAILAYEFPALSETFVLAHATGMIDLGHRVTILADHPRAERHTHEAVARYRLGERTLYRTRPGNKLSRAASVALRTGSRVLRHPIVASRAMCAVRYRGSLRALPLLDWWSRCDTLPRFDIVHAHFGPMGASAVALQKLGALSGRIVTSFHGVDMSRSLMADPGQYAELFRSGDAFLPVSEYWRNRLIERGCPAERIRVHHMGIDADAIAFQSRRIAGRGKPDRPLRVITVGRLVEKKGIAYALEAMSLFAHLGYAFTHTVVGDGPLRAHLERMAGVMGIADQVRFLGARDHRNVMQLIRQSDVMLAPSTTDGDGDQEGIPLTLMEAMAAGLPVISTLHSGIPELIEHGVSGLLVVERDVEGLAAALRALVDTEDLSPRLATAARAAIEREFNQPRLVRELAGYYRALLDGPPRGTETVQPLTPRPVARRYPTAAFHS